MALFSNAKAIKAAKEAAGQQQAASIYGMEAASAQAARQIAGQEAQANIFNALGQPGTFGPGATTGTYGDGSTNMWDDSAVVDQGLSQFATYGGKEQFGRGKGSKKKGGINSSLGGRAGIIDPEGYANQVIGTIPFQIRSQQTAEAQQLLNREGPEWDLLENATIGTIHEGAALQLRDTLRQLKNNYAKGGTARRTAVNEYSTILAQENAMRSRVQETWQANLRLHSYVRQNADRVEAGNRSFVENINGLSAAHMSAMQATAALQVEAGKTAGLLAGQAYEIRASQKARNFGSQLLEGVIMAAASNVTDQAFGGAGAEGTGGSQGAMGAIGSSLLNSFMTPTGVNSREAQLGTQANYTPTQQAAIDRAYGTPNAALQRAQAPRSSTSGNVDSPFTSNAWRISTGKNDGYRS